MSINDSLEEKEINELKKELKKHQKEYKLYQRIQAVLMVKSGESRKQAAEYIGVHRNTVGTWVTKYNKEGLDGLKVDYSNCGAESRLTNQQLSKLFEILTDPNEHYTIRDARNIIKKEFDVEYSNKQVWVITRKKLGLNYRKPYIVYESSPDNADEIFKKKTSEIDVEEEDLTIEDESRAQNTNNSNKSLCKPTIDGVKDPNILVKSGNKFGINAIGFQGVNTSSGIFFNEKNNANNFAITLCKYQLTRITNPKAIKMIDNIINNSNLDITNIKLELLYDALNEDEYYDLFDDNMEIIYKKFNKACKKCNINYYKTNLILKKRLLNALNDDNLINLMKRERKLNIVLDNARIHTSKVVEMTCDILNINLVFLPPYCPFLNPIENVWKDVKREIYNSFYTNLGELTEIFEDSFMARVYSETYYENWLDKFFA